MSKYGAQQRQLYFARRILPELKEKKQLDTVPCYQCGKPVKAKDAIVRDKRILCQECYNTLRVVKDGAKE